MSVPTKTVFLTGIYAIRHVASGRVYVGSSQNIAGRWRQHKHLLRRGEHKNPKLMNAWAKYGEDAFAFEVLELCAESDLLTLEQRYFSVHDSVSSGFNISEIAGRERAGKRHTPEAIRKMSDSHMGSVVSADHRAKLSAAFKGRVFSDETRAKISASKMGKKRAPFTEQAKLNMSAGMKGRIHSPECRAKLSAAHKARRGAK